MLTIVVCVLINTVADLGHLPRTLRRIAAKRAVSYGFTFGASATDFVGTVSNIRTPFDVNGVYGAAGAGVAVGPGAGGIVLANQNGAVLTISGPQMGLIVAADLNGLVITLR